MEEKRNLIFALDIGTRTIIGIAGEYTDDEELIVKAHKIAEHKKRSMHDGQIHDIEGVSKDVKKIVDEIEGELGVKFDVVSIAAAGRALRTKKTSIEISFDDRTEINRSHVDNLELQAIKKAQDEINAEEELEGVSYYSVGYTISGYYLDEDRIDNLVGHKGQRIGCDVLATFLPRGVVESLYTVISRVGLEVGSMTLEPIAAMNVAIKKDLRLLNLALVDIGAGTSDIAITREGDIVAYGMTQTAGDEITDEISRQFLLDFNDAEALKISLNKEDEHRFKNILGMEFNLTTEEVVEKLKPVVETIANEIADKILEFNERAPSAVFLVGGSSQFPGIAELIAERLEMPAERVVIRDLTAIDFVKNLDIKTPDYITPVGIAIEGAEEKYKSFIRVKFNGSDFRMFNTDSVRVSDLLLMVGYDIKKLMPKLSDEFAFFIDGRKRYLDSNGEGAKILVNGEESNIRKELKNDDIIEIIEPETIVKKTHIAEVVDFDRYVEHEGDFIQLVRGVTLNGKEAGPNDLLKPMDEIKLIEMRTVGDLREFLDVPFFKQAVVNDEEVSDITLLKSEDKVYFVEKAGEDKSDEKPVAHNTKDENKEQSGLKKIGLSVNGEFTVYEYEKENFVFVDLFDHIDIDLTKPHGELVLKINDEPADYMRALKEGDKIEIRWE